MKLGGGTIGFIGENLRSANGLRFFFSSLSHKFVFIYYGVSIGVRNG
jgi:hypothetical protein